MTIVDSENTWPLRPGVVTSARVWRLRNDFQIDDALASMAHRRSDAVITGITTTDYNDVLILRVDEFAIGQLRIEQALGIPMQEFHRHVDSLELPTWNWQVTWLCGPGGQDNRIELFSQVHRTDVATDFSVGPELDTFRGEQVHPALDDVLFQLHVRNAVHQQSADPVCSFEDSDFMSDAVQLSRSSQTSRATSDNGDSLARSFGRRIRLDPALVESVVDDRAFDVLDRDRGIGDPENARSFTRSRTDSPGEFREVVRLV